MSRMRRFLRMLVSSYLSLAANTVYGIVSVPLALHFLSRSEFGLWALMAQIGGYLLLIDTGMSSSLALFLIDHKDHPERGEYGSVLLTGQLVLVVQGLIAALAGYVLSPLLASLLDIPPALQHSFVVLMRWQSLLLGATIAAKTVGQLLYAHQRLDLMNYTLTLGVAVMTGVLWVALRCGAGVVSVVWANAAAWLVGTIILVRTCLKLHLFPPHGAWGRPSWARFKELFGFGKDIFLIAIGAQLMWASQTIIISRALGLETVAIWWVGTKVFTLLWQLTRQILHSSVPALAEMLVRKEHVRLQERFKAVTVLSASVAGVAAVLAAACNAPFVTIWTHGRITWATREDVLLGVWLVVLAVQSCHVGFLGVTKDIRFGRWIFLVEGVVFVGLASFVARWAGLSGIIGCSAVCTIAISGAYGVRRSCEYFAIPWAEPGWNWLKPLGQILLGLVPLAIAVWWLSEPLAEWQRLLLRGVLLGGFGSCLLLRFGIPSEFKCELVRRTPHTLRPLVSRFVGHQSN